MPTLYLIGVPSLGIDFEQEDLDLIEDKTPVDTGFLKSSFRIVGPLIVNDADYASYVEWGTQYMEGFHMVADSLEAIWENIYKRHPEVEYHDLLPGEMEVFVGP